jgi:hypothetical protein
MSSYTATVSSIRPPDEVFAYLADFRSVADWDPSITSSDHVSGDDPVKIGATFRVTTRTTLRDVVLEYTTTALDSPEKIVLRGENVLMVSTDTITINVKAGGGSNVTYSAKLRLKHGLALFDPLLQLGFNRLGDNARDGLNAKLNLQP